MRTKIYCQYSLLLFVMLYWSSLVWCQGNAEQENAVVSDVQALLRETIRKSQENWRLVRQHDSSYTSRHRWIVRKQDKPEESELYEIYNPDSQRKYKRSQNVWILLEKNGKAMAPEQIEKERLKAGEKLAKIESGGIQITEPESGSPVWMTTTLKPGGGKSIKLDVPEMMTTCDFHSPRRERLSERETIVLEFRPRPDAPFSERTRYLSQVEGRIWIDAQDQVVIRVAAWPKGTIVEHANSDAMMSRAALFYDLVKAKEGIWLPRRVFVNGSKYPDLFPTLKNAEVLSEHFDYQYFGVGIEKEQIKPPETGLTQDVPNLPSSRAQM